MASTIPTPVARTEPGAAVPAVRAEAAAVPPKPASAPSAPERQPATRLMIEEVGGSYVYTVLDRVSGQVLAQIPRDRLDELAAVDGYAAGAVLDTEA